MGSLPPELGNLSSLKRLNLVDNQLTGSLPPELGNLSALEGLWLSGNQLTTLPPELGNLSSLVTLMLYDNQLATIPPELGSLSKLKGLVLSDNQLRGSLPRELGKLLALDNLNLTRNQLTGSLPPELGKLLALDNLNLSDNQLTGSLPSELGNLLALRKLNLTYNRLSGSIPRSFLQLRWLSDFSFKNNAGLCAPPDDEFQRWLRRNSSGRGGPNCAPSVSVEEESALPAEFAIKGNYPNPFRTSTTLQFDLPWPARVGVEIFGVTGRLVIRQYPADFPAGWGLELPLRDVRVSPGAYLYRITITTPEEQFTHTGQIVRIR